VKKEKEIQDDERLHAWQCALALSKMMEARGMGEQGWNIQALMEAAYHAGAAHALYKTRF